MPKKTNQPKREMTKRQLSHHQRESRLQRRILMVGITVIVIIIAIISFGIYSNKFKPFGQTVIKVGNTSYSMDYYIDMLSYYGTLIGNPQNIPNITTQVEQIIAQNKILIDEAAKLGFTVSDDEVDKAIKDAKIGSDPARKDATRMQLLLTKMKSDYFDPKIVPAAQRQVLAMFLESQSQADDIVLNQLNLGADFSQVATDNSLETNSQTKKGSFDWLPKGILPGLLGNSVLEDAVFAADVKLNVPVTVEDLSQSKSVGYWLVKYTETQTSSVDSSKQLHTFVMLLPSAAKANEIKAQLDGGADFVELAKANSQYTSAADNGGDLNFISKGFLGDAVDAVLFPTDATKQLAVNAVSAPLKDITRSTTGGVWLFEVAGTDENRAIEGDNRATLVNDALNTWIGETWTANENSVSNLLDDNLRLFAIQEALKR